MVRGRAGRGRGRRREEEEIVHKVFKTRTSENDYHCIDVLSTVPIPTCSGFSKAQNDIFPYLSHDCSIPYSHHLIKQLLVFVTHNVPFVVISIQLHTK